MHSQYIAYVVVNKEGIITIASQTYLNMLGKQFEDVMGKYILDVVPNSKLLEVLKTRKMEKIDVCTINGQETIVSRIPIIKDGEIVGAIAKILFLNVDREKFFIKKNAGTRKTNSCCF